MTVRSAVAMGPVLAPARRARAIRARARHRPARARRDDDADLVAPLRQPAQVDRRADPLAAQRLDALAVHVYARARQLAALRLAHADAEAPPARARPARRGTAGLRRRRQ